jgi:DNA-binding IscR family transcriptional regulator
MRTLVRANVGASVPGVYGGYHLVKEPTQVSLWEVISAFEADFGLILCDTSTLDEVTAGAVGNTLTAVNRDICVRLQQSAVSDLLSVGNRVKAVRIDEGRRTAGPPRLGSLGCGIGGEPPERSGGLVSLSLESGNIIARELR